MKTALQEAIEDIKEYRDSGNADVDTCNAILMRLASMVHKEKEVIMDAYNDGQGNGIDIAHPLSNTKNISAEDYYNQTFKTNEK